MSNEQSTIGNEQLAMNKTPPHLGGHGHITHTDMGALIWCREALGVRSMLDVGCGPGGQVKIALALGMQALGIDGDLSINDINVEHHDFTQGTARDLAVGAELIWCVEFLEHLEREFLPNFFETIKYAEYAIVTAAPPGKKGFHHVNCQPWEYWLDKFNTYRWMENEALTRDLRANSTMLEEGEARGVNPRDFIRQRGHFMQRIKDFMYD